MVKEWVYSAVTRRGSLFIQKRLPLRVTELVLLEFYQKAKRLNTKGERSVPWVASPPCPTVPHEALAVFHSLGNQSCHPHSAASLSAWRPGLLCRVPDWLVASVAPSTIVDFCYPEATRSISRKRSARRMSHMQPHVALKYLLHSFQAWYIQPPHSITRVAQSLFTAAHQSL